MSVLTKFLFEGLPVRGMLVRLTDSWQEVLRRRATSASTRPRCVCCWARWRRPAC